MELKMFDDFLKKYDGQMLRYWRYKRPGLSYDGFGDGDKDTPLVSERADFGRIVEAYALPDGDVMLGFSESEDNRYIEYQKLSELDIAWSNIDQENEDD